MFTVSNQTNVYCILSNCCICINISCGERDRQKDRQSQIVDCTCCVLLVCRVMFHGLRTEPESWGLGEDDGAMHR